MKIYRKCFLCLLTICYLMNFICMNGTIHASELKNTKIDVAFKEQLNETKNEADIILNLTYDKSNVQINKIINPDKTEVVSDTTLTTSTYHVKENNSYVFEIHYNDLLTKELKQETFTYEVKTIEIIKESIPKVDVVEESTKEIPQPLPDTPINPEPSTETKEPAVSQTPTEMPKQEPSKDVEVKQPTQVTPEPVLNNTLKLDTEPVVEPIAVTQYTVEFDSSGGSLVASQTIDQGNKVIKPSNPTKKGLVFDGWYKEDTFITEWVFDSNTVTDNIKLYAKWAQLPRPLTKQGFMFWDDEVKEGLNPPPYSVNQTWVGSKLYWGSNEGTPMKWRILNTNENDFGQTGGMLIVQDSATELSTFGVQFDSTDTGNAYHTSSLATYIDGKFTTTLHEKEQNATLSSSRYEESYAVTGRDYNFKDNFSEKKWFSPTARMFMTESYGFSSTSADSQTRSFGTSFWLSSSNPEKPGDGSVVNTAGFLARINPTYSYDNPMSASQLNPNSILFISSAEGGKVSGPIGENALTTVPTTTSEEYKLTLKDTSQTLTITSAIADELNLVTINFNKTGEGTTLSAIITDSTGENIISYGQIATIATGNLMDQVATIQLPSDFYSAGYKLQMFTEIYKGDKNTDYASALVDVTVNKNQEKPVLSSGLVFWNAETKEKLNPPAYVGNQAWVGNRVYWGMNGSTPMKWRILNTNETGFGQTDGVLMISDASSYMNSNLHGFNPKGTGNEYKNSTLGTTIDGLFSTLLHSKEQEATLASTVNEENYTITGVDYKFKDDFSDKKWFAPTVRLLTSGKYGFTNYYGNSLTRGFGNYYWTSTAVQDTTSNSVSSIPTGELKSSSITNTNRIMGATQLDSNAILLVSNAEGGKTSGTIGEHSLTAVPDIASEELKFTLKDTTQLLTVTSTHVDASNLATIYFNKTGDGTTLSAMITDATGENIISYGQIATLVAGALNEQTATIQLPSDFFRQGLKLKVFTEIYNGDKQTDYASEFVDTDIREYQIPTSPKAGFVLWDEDTKQKLNPPMYSGDQAWVGSKLYWGMNNGTPMKWRILNTNETSLGQTDGGVLIMHDNASQLSTTNLTFNSSNAGNAYPASNLATFIDNQFTNTLHLKEQEATLPSSINNDTYVTPNMVTLIDNFSNKKWFAPTSKMMLNESYGYPNAIHTNQTRNLGSPFWTSSALQGQASNVNATYYGGNLNSVSVNNSLRAVSASQLNPNAILFLSNAVGGKDCGDLGVNSLTSIPEIASGEYKVTLIDSTQTISVSSAYTDENNIATINYSKTGNGSTISAIITDSTGENIISYGRIATLTEGNVNKQSVTVQLPEEFFAQGYKLKVFTEIYNGDKQTDYASAIVDTNVKQYQAPTLPNAGVAIWNEETKQQLNPVTYNGNQPWAGSRLYWGNNNGTPMKWRILNTNENGFGQTSGMLIMHDDANQLSTSEKEFNPWGGGSIYEGSSLDTYINSRYSNSLTTSEKNATLTSSKTEYEYRISYFGNFYKDVITDKKWFAPTARMITTESYGFINSPVDDQTRNYENAFWLSSDSPIFENVGYGNESWGNIIESSVDNTKRVVGASQLDESTILLVSDAVGGKSSGPVGENCLKPVPTKASGEYKLTLKDSEQSISVSTAYADKNNNAVISGVKNGTGTAISAIVTDSTGKKVISYGIVKTSPDGTWPFKVTFKLPDEFFTNGYQLKLFSEIIYGDKKTDYASEFLDVEVSPYHPPTLPNAGLVLWNEETKESLNPVPYESNRPWAGSRLYWGNNAGTPMKWKILSTKENGLGQSDGILIMHDDVSQLTTTNMMFNPVATSNVYNTSQLDNYIEGRFNDSLDAKEKNATFNSTTDSVYFVSGVEASYKDNFIDKKWFAPTAKIMTTVDYGYPNSNIITLTREYDSHFWYSSNNMYSSSKVGIQSFNGAISISDYSSSSRPISASQLNPNSILFVSNAEGGKSSGTIGKDALKEVPTEASGEYKLTLKDTTQSVQVTSTLLNTSMVATVTYNKTGTGTKLGAIVTDSAGENIISYGQIATISASDLNDQTVTVQLPSDFVKKGYRLKIFTELCQGDKKTDYASELVDTNAALAKYTVTYDSKGGSEVASETIDDGSFLTKPDIPTYEGYRFNGWYIDEAYTSLWDFETDFISNDMTLYAKWDKLYTLTLDANTGSGEMSPIEFILDETITLPKNTFTKDNYGFSGWNTKADGSGTMYEDEATLPNMLDSDITLYATWNTQVANIFIDIPSGLSLVDKKEERTAIREVTLNIVKNPQDAPWYPDEDIQIRANPNITLTNILSPYSYEVEVFKEDNSKYTDSNTPLATMNIKDEAQQSSKFTLKTPISFSKPKGTYRGVMNFIIEFVPTP